ncbi:MAG: hypothetical protein ACYTGH_21950 [Planctomycetota bacterium]
MPELLRIPLLLCCLLALGACEEKEEEESTVVREWRRGPVTLRLRLDRDTLTVAESLAVTLEAEAPEHFEVESPEFDLQGSSFQRMNEEAVRETLLGEGRIRRAYRFQLEPLLAGPTEVPAQRLRFKPKPEADWVALKSDAIPIPVLSTLPTEEEEPALRELAGPLEAPTPIAYYVVPAVALLLLMGAGIFYGRQRRRQVPVGPPPRPPHEIAEEALERLLQERLIDRGEISTFYLRLSMIVRTYIEARFHLRAPEQTTEEFLVTARNSEALTGEQRNRLQDFLRLSDLVKFARYLPPLSEIDAGVESCRGFIRETMPTAEEHASTTAAEGQDGV